MNLLHQAPSSTRTTIAAASVVCIAMSAGAASTELARQNFTYVIVLVSLIATPAILVLVTRNWLYLGFLTVLAQVLEGNEIPTPFATLTVGSLLLVASITLYWSDFWKEVRCSRSSKALFSFILLYAASHLFQALHIETRTAIRGLVTVGSFAAFWILGFYLGLSRQGRSMLYRGGLWAFFILGLFSVLRGFGIDFGYAIAGPPRDFYGFTSPFPRNYGLGVTLAATALLLPLILPRMVFEIASPSSTREQLRAILLYGVVFSVTLLTFQSRSMLIEIVLSLALSMSLFSRIKIIKPVVLFGAIVGAFRLIPSLMEVDYISSDIRTESYSYALHYIKDHPSVLAVGTDVTTVIQNITAISSFKDIQGDAPIHNMFLDETLKGGVIASLSVAFLLAFPVIIAAGKWRRRQLDSDLFALVIVSSLCIAIEISINPIGANVAGLWLAFGQNAAIISRVHGTTRARSPEGIPA